MKYTIENLTYKAGNDFGDDMITFYFDVHFTEPEDLWAKQQSLLFFQFVPFFREHNPKLYEYMQTVRNGLDEWGLAEGATFDAMGEEAVGEVMALVRKFVEREEWAEGVYEWHLRLEKLRNDPDAEEKFRELEEKFEQLTGHVPNMKQANERSVRFKKELTRKLREIAMEVYPEIKDADVAQLKKFSKLFVKNILDIETTLHNFLREL